MRKDGYFFIILIVLIFTQLLSYESAQVKIIGLVFLFFYSFFVFHILKDQFLFIISILSQCIIFTIDVLGGITLAPFLIIVSYIFFKGQLYIKDRFVRTCLFVLVATTYLGYIVKNQGGLFDIIQSSVIFTSIILTFIFVQNFKFAKTQVKTLLSILTFLSGLLLLTALNQKFVFIDSTVPMLGGFGGYRSASSVGLAYEGRYPSLFADYELFSEFALLMFILSFSLYVEKKSVKHFRLGQVPLLLMILSFANIIITGTRSGFLLMFIFMFLFFIIRLDIFFTKRIFGLIFILVLLIPLIFRFGDLIGFDYIIDRFQEIDSRYFSLNSIVSGDQINREIVYAEGYERITEGNWVLGYGFGLSSSNDLAWFSSSEVQGRSIRDFHSLYLSIPMIYGWIGSVTYLLLIIYIIFLSFKRYFLFSESPLCGFYLAFSFLFVFFLLNQIKINSLRIYNYHYLIWILMGFALAFINMKIDYEEEQ